MYNRIAVVIVCLVFLHGMASADQATDEAKRIVVFDFQSQARHNGLGQHVAEVTRVIIPEFKRFHVIDSGVMRLRLSENGINMDEVTDSGTGFEAVKTLDSDFFIVGNIREVGDTYSLNIKLIDSKVGAVIQASGLEFKGGDLLEIRKIVRGLLSNLLGFGGISGKPVITEVELKELEKKPFMALNLTVGSTIVQAAALGFTVSIPAKDDPNHLWPSLALMIPPVTPFYTEDWDIVPLTIGFSVGAGIFNFAGRSLINNAQGDGFRTGFGTVLIVLGGAGKIASVIFDTLNVRTSVDKYNNSLKERYFISSNIDVFPIIDNQFAGLGLAARF